MRIFIACSRNLWGSPVIRLLRDELAAVGHECIEEAQVLDDPEARPAMALHRCDLVLCVMDEAASEVFLTAGYAMGAGIPVLLLATHDFQMPFDLQDVSCIRADVRDPSAAFIVMKHLERIPVPERALPKHFNSYREVLLTYDDDPNYFEGLTYQAFEDAIFRWFHDKGFHPVRLPGRHVGWDILLERFGRFNKTLVEIKKLGRSSKVSVGPVQALKEEMYQQRADHGLLITSSDFTPSARRLAEGHEPSIELWHLRRILNQIHEDNVTERMRTELRREDLLRAHEAAAPLQMIENNLAILQGYLSKKGAIDSELNRIVGETGSLVERAGFLNRFSLLLARESTEWHLDKLAFRRDIVQPVVRMLHYQAAGRHCEILVADSLGGIPHLYLDRLRMTEVIFSLVSNAVKYSLEGRNIHVRSRREREGWVICIESMSTPISAQDAQRIFDDGYRGQNTVHLNSSGEGRGLFLCHRTLQEMGSWIRLTGYGNPVVFSFLLPNHVTVPGWWPYEAPDCRG